MAPTTSTRPTAPAGFEREHHSAQLPASVIVAGPYSAGGGYAAAKELLARDGARPTGVLVATLTMALGALAAFAEAGVRVPADMSVIGFDDGELAAVAQPPLTCVAMAHDQMGATAVGLLEAVIAGEPAKSAMVGPPPELVVRASVAPPPV